jgi:GTP-binding protein EngB required for normal cell division
VHNVILFGESGVGKSSIVNLVVGSQAAKTSPDADACTTRTQPYDVIINGKKYKLWDTTGLDGGTFGLLRAAIAERNLKKFIRNLLKKSEPSLLIYCVRASRATRALVRHYQSVRSTTREYPIPVVIVVTGLENSRGDMENWWHRNASELSNHGMEFTDHACVTSIDDDPRDPILVRTRRTSSQDAVRDLISRNCIRREQCENIPQFHDERQDDLRGWTWVVWTYLVSTLLPS